MTKQEELDFQKLTQDRSQIADSINRRSMRGLWDSVVEKYSEPAHFVYELLQNADDAKADSARFILERNRLIFAHNGKRWFSVSNPDTEDYDTEHNKLGDINAITSVGNSNKPEEAIGRFGMGFKAVFEYTTSPLIYGPSMCFRIDRYIVPILLNDDYPSRHPDETLFVLPFNRQDKSAENSYSDISGKLQALTYPLLFLTNLKSISFELGKHIGLYEKRCDKELLFSQTVAQHLTLTQNKSSKVYTRTLWLFTRHDDCNRTYSCGFFMDDKGKLSAVHEPAFCFFPTKETTGLSFIVHAPFLLTDSREGIRAGVAHNVKMIELLAKLAADSFLYLRDIGVKEGTKLIDDDITALIPYNESSFNEVVDKRKASFKPFFTAIHQMLSSSRIIPSMNGYVESKNAYWSAVPQLTRIFSDEQLAEITGNPNAAWVFVSIGRDGLQRNNSVLCEYIDSIIRTSLNEDHILDGRVVYSRKGHEKDIQGISADFIERQHITWLHQFYEWLSEAKGRANSSKKKCVFLNQDRKAVAAFNSEGMPILFLPTKDISDCDTIFPKLLENESTAQFFSSIGIKAPSIKDYIYNTILPTYRSNNPVDIDSHFMLFFKYYRQCPHEKQEEFIDLIKNYQFLSCNTQDSDEIYRGRGNDLYFPTTELLSYFASKSDTWFVAFDKYKQLVDKKTEKTLVSFLTELGVNRIPRLFRIELGWSDVNKRQLPMPRSTRGRTWREIKIDGCCETIAAIVEQQSKEKSIALWNVLKEIIHAKCYSYQNLDNVLSGYCSYFYYHNARVFFTSSDVELIRSSAWLINDNGVFMSPQEITKRSLSQQYNLDDEVTDELIRFLHMGEKSDVIGDDSEGVEEIDESKLSDKQREQLLLGKQCEQLGLTEEDILEAGERKRLRTQQDTSASSLEQSKHISSDDNVSCISQFDNDNNDGDSKVQWDDNEIILNASELDDEISTIHQQPSKKLSKTASRIVRDILKHTKNEPTVTLDESLYETPDEDADDYIRPTVDYSARIERAKQKSAGEISRIEYFENLQSKATQSQKYSYSWFNALLEMESLSNSENSLTSREVSISFAHVEREEGTHRTLVLKHPSRYIPQFMEDLADIPLVLSMGDTTKTVAIEVASIKSYTLRVKLKANVNIDDIDLSKVAEARIDAKSPAFLLEELRKQFGALDYDDSFDMQANLCENIEFIFGPPGTGKTTYLAQKVLIPLMKHQHDLKILVLTPTNKAADVLLNRVIEVMGNDTSYQNWLVRFGATHDEAIEQSPVFRDKTFDIRSLARSVTVTTIARFPYDFFMPSDAHIYLRNINWDYIIIDEASMIPLSNVVYPLYKKTPRKFVIAGDPFQIEPITAVDLWKNENIYTMVQLNSFVAPKTIPHDYNVTLLTTQYRSTPILGDVFSKFAYGGILKHFRSQASRRSLNIESILPVKSLNLIKFPVSKYESIYRAKRLQRSSSYQVYSAIFTYEFVSYLVNRIAELNQSIVFKVGVIAPYRAQADLIDKLLASTDMPEQIDVQVGTIHGFQGDECNIILAVFNTPPSISTHGGMFLNNRNIINVSISRAKDYLFVLMPDDNTYNIENLRLVKRVEQLMKASGDCAEFAASDIEQTMFGNSHYLEENAFSTGHQNVNVYGLPEKCYEVRSEDNAVDVQVHKARGNDEHQRESPRESSANAKQSDGLQNRAPLINSSTVEFFWLDRKTKTCPYDGEALKTIPIPVEKNNGDKKKLNMAVCSRCGKRFITNGSLADSINISEYKLIGHPISLAKQEAQASTQSVVKTSGNSLSTTQTSKEMVRSKRYGIGEVVGRRISDTNVKIVKIRFSIGEKEYAENKAFRSGALVRI